MRCIDAAQADTGGTIRRALDHLCYVHIGRDSVDKKPTTQLLTGFQ
jgi:hypothetical protein